MGGGTFKILVLADDLSGAAEVAGIAASWGLTVEVQTELSPQTVADVLSVDTRSRSLSPEWASLRVKKVYEKVHDLDPEWIFKKTDSVLRGNVRAELETLMDLGGYPQVVFIPANPEKQRVIRGGDYYIQGQPLNRSAFANDPEFPVQTSRVKELLGSSGVLSVLCIGTDPLPAEGGIVIPDVTHAGELTRRAEEVSHHKLTAGAAEYFEALLKHRMGERLTRVETGGKGDEPRRSLFVCGSKAAWNQGIQQQADNYGVSVFTLSPGGAWSKAVVESLQETQRAMIAIGNPDAPLSGPGGNEYLNELVTVVQSVLHESDVDQIFLEGGATASALIQRMEWSRFDVLPIPITGVGVLRPLMVRSAPLLYIKPGSYPWPEAIWNAL